MAKIIRKSIPWFLILALVCFAISIGFNFKSSEIKADSAEPGTSVTVGNDAPAFATPTTDNPYEYPTSDDTTPTDMDADVTFKAIATDANGDNWYLAVCKTAVINAGAAGGAPTCDTDSTWVISTSASASGVEITETYTITASETLESYAWHAYACDDNSGTAACSEVSNSGRDTVGGSPFAVNHRPTFTAVSTDGPKDPDGTVRVTADTYNDTDTGGAQDTVSMYVCKTAVFTGGTCEGGQEWCNVTGITPTNPLYCDLTVPNPAAHGSTAQTYYPYIKDSHGLFAISGKQGSTETYGVNDVAPTLADTPSLNTGSAIDLTVGGELLTTDIYLTGTITDDNGCADIVDANTKADAWMTTLTTRAGCDSSGEGAAPNNKCYYHSSCAYDSATENCGAMPDKTGGYKCTISFQYYANPTDAGTPWVDDDWNATLIPGDELGENTAGEGNATAVELQSFLALGLATSYDSIAYGSVAAGGNTDPLNAENRVEATGNVGLDANLSGTTMTGDGDPIAIANQKHGLGVTAPAWPGTDLSGTPTLVQLECCKSGYTLTPEWKRIWWGIEIDEGQAGGEYTGTNTIEAVVDADLVWCQP